MAALLSSLAAISPGRSRAIQSPIDRLGRLSSALQTEAARADGETMTPNPPIGALIRHSALGSEAVYEVIEAGKDIVTAAVVSAPGLPVGMEIHLTARDARAMQHFKQPLRPAAARARRRAVPAAPQHRIGAS
jgi:hypothetical protein